MFLFVLSADSTAESNSYTGQSYKPAPHRPRPSHNPASSTSIRNRPLLQCVQPPLLFLRQAQPDTQQAIWLNNTHYLPQESRSAANLLSVHELQRGLHLVPVIYVVVRVLYRFTVYGELSSASHPTVVPRLFRRLTE